MKDELSKEMPFWDHIEELRWRLIKSIISIVFGSIITYKYSDEIVYLFVLPVYSLDLDINLQILKVTSMFTIKLTIALFGGLIIGSPILLYQFWKFLAPAFNKQNSFTILFIIFFSSIFFIFGMSFAYFILVPFSLYFFTSLTSIVIDVNYNYTLEGYLTYVIWMIFGSGLLFQLPVISTLLTKIGILTPSFLIQYRKLAIVLFLIIAAILTPPDPLSQILIVVPLVILYEFSIIISKILSPIQS